MELKVTVEEITGQNVLRDDVGTGLVDEIDFQIWTELPSGAPIVAIGDRVFKIPMLPFIKTLAKEVRRGPGT